MKTMHLFAGAGGGLLADLILGHTPVCAVENNPYCCEVLRERRDEGWFPGLCVYEDDIRLWDPSEWTGRVDCVHAGFPCQDISPAGRGVGIRGAKSGLWAEVVRVAGIVRPRYLFLENSAAIVGRGLDVVLGDLAALGFDAEWCVLSAAAVGAPHRRERWWCLATWRANDSDAAEQRCTKGLRFRRTVPAKRTGGVREDGSDAASGGLAADGGAPRQSGHADELHSDVADAKSREPRESSELQGREDTTGRGGDRRGLATSLQAKVADAKSEHGRAGQQASDDGWSDGAAVTGNGWWGAEPDVGRVAHGLAARVQRLECLGNGQVPLCAAAAWSLLAGRIGIGVKEGA